MFDGTKVIRTRDNVKEYFLFFMKSIPNECIYGKNRVNENRRIRRIIFHLYLRMTFDFHIDDAIFAGKVKRQEGSSPFKRWFMNVNILEHDSNRDPSVRESLYLPSGQSDPKTTPRSYNIRCNNSGEYLPARARVILLTNSFKDIFRQPSIITFKLRLYSKL